MFPPESCAHNHHWGCTAGWVRDWADENGLHFQEFEMELLEWDSTFSGFLVFFLGGGGGSNKIMASRDKF